MSLRKKVIKLAYENPELREHLVPLLSRTAASWSDLNRKLENYHRSKPDVSAVDEIEIEIETLKSAHKEAKKLSHYAEEQVKTLSRLHGKMADTVQRVHWTEFDEDPSLAEDYKKEWRGVLEAVEREAKKLQAQVKYLKKQHDAVPDNWQPFEFILNLVGEFGDAMKAWPNLK